MKITTKKTANAVVLGSYRIEPELNDALREYCYTHRRSLSEVVRSGIRKESGYPNDECVA
jgi:hypothetical protein